MGGLNVNEATAIREMALRILEIAGGQLSPTQDGGQAHLLSAEVGGLRITYRTSSTKVPAVPRGLDGGLTRLSSSRHLHHTLDIWDGTAKKFAVAWGFGGMRVAAFRRDRWLGKFREMARHVIPGCINENGQH
jgi:hypothetical protein